MVIIVMQEVEVDLFSHDYKGQGLHTYISEAKTNDTLN